MAAEPKQEPASSAAAGGGGAVRVNAAQFIERVKSVYRSWGRDNTNEGLWKGANALVISLGGNDDQYQLSVALHQWLLGYEFPETLVVFAAGNNVHFYTTAKKITILEGLLTPAAANDIHLHFILRKKESEAEGFAKVIDVLRASNGGERVGKVDRDVWKAWETALDESRITQVEAGPAFYELLAIKDSNEQGQVRKAAHLTASVLRNFLLPKIEKIIDKEEKIPHIKLAEMADEVFSHPSKAKVELSMDMDNAESAFMPIIQSGGKYELKPSAESNGDILQFHCIVASLGGRYKSYCSNVSRTFFFDPHASQEEMYKIAQDAQALAIRSMTPGTKLSAVYEKVRDFVRRKKPGFEEKLMPSCGFGMGIQFREQQLAINAKNTRSIKAGMVFNVSVGLKDLQAGDKTYAVLLADTVLIKDDAPEVLTSLASKDLTDVAWYQKGDEGGAAADLDHDVVIEGRRRVQKEDTTAADEARRKHQEELASKMNDEAKARLVEGGNSGGRAGGDASSRRVGDSYDSAASIPASVKPGQIYVDQRAETVLVPIFGQPVPFHVSFIKSMTKSDEGDFTYLRINFIAPGMAFGNKNLPHLLENPNAHFVRELAFRAQDGKSLANTLRIFNEIKKQATARDQRIEETKDLVEQESLVLNRGGAPARLLGLSIRPNLAGRKTVGALEAHVNGLRFTSNKGERLDIMFNNIKHAFFQDAEGELIVLLHFHLKNPIMIGKKKSLDVQFYTEVGEAVASLDGKKRSTFDRDEIEDEQRDRELRNKLNKEFHNFVRKVEKESEERSHSVRFDIPYRELAFNGVAGKTTVLLQPTVECLVHLVEPPFFVLTLADVELCYLERIDFSLRNFDMVFIFKDYSKSVAHVTAIPRDRLESVQEWLDSVNIPYFEGRANLNWPSVMKNVLADVQGFLDDGGWKTVLGNDDSEEGEQVSESGSEFEIDEDEESESDYDEYSVDDSNEDESDDDDASGGGGGGGAGGESDEEGLDWEEMDRRAAKEDKKRAAERGGSDSDGDRKRKKTSGGSKQRTL